MAPCINFLYLKKWVYKTSKLANKIFWEDIEQPHLPLLPRQYGQMVKQYRSKKEDG